MTPDMESALRVLHPYLQQLVLRALHLSGPVHAWAMIAAWTPGAQP